jgi:VCBS repeat-containing protein
VTYTDTLTVASADGTTHVLTVNILGTNDAAVIGTPTVADVTEDTAVVAGNLVAAGTISIADVDQGQSTFQTTVTANPADLGTLVLAPNGSYTYTVANSAVQYLGANDTKVDTFTVTSFDGTSKNVSFTIHGTNDAPVSAAGSVLSSTIGVPFVTSGTNTLSPAVAAELNAPGLISGLPGGSGFGTLALPAGDDNSSGKINFTSVFGSAGLDFFGTEYTGLFVNNNGNVTFGAASTTFTPTTISAGLNNPIIAPFWADVDTRAAGGGAVYYDLDSADGVMTITWDNVGYYNQKTNKLDSFQLVLINEGNGNFDIEFRYGNIQWTTGDASSGSNGLGGTPARAGYSAGDNVHSFELSQSGNQTALLALPTTLGNSGIAGVDEFAVRNGAVGPSSLTANGTINFSDPDLSDTHSIQSVTYTGSGNELGTLSLTEATDTTGTGTGGQFVWTYSVNAQTARTALDSINTHTKVETFNVVISDGHTGGTLSQTVSVTLNETNTDPAGVAGSAINLGLTQLAGAGSEAITVTGSPINWTIDGATHNADGSWKALTNDFSALTITPDVNFVGATLLNVLETWTNSNGSGGAMVVSDNVEAYAPGSPIFAVAGDDHLTGAGTGNLFVFAQPIGNDIIYNFNTTLDKIDLIDFNNIASFADIRGNIADDTNGNAVINIGANETITLNGVNAASITASDFVFNQAPITQNTGAMQIGDGAHIAASGTINNTGTIELLSTGDETDLQIIQQGITLTGAGHVLLSDNAENVIVGTSADVTLTNVDNNIDGSGDLGGGQLTLINDSHGVIAATSAFNQLTIDTGAGSFTNHGIVLSNGAGGLEIKGGIFSDGVLEASAGLLKVDGDVVGGGIALIDGGNMEFGAASDAIVQFSGSSSGTLVLDDVSYFTGSVTGFAYGDTIDLAGIDPANVSVGNSGSLEVHYGPGASDYFSLVGNYDPASFTISSDNKGGAGIVWNQTSATSATIASGGSLELDAASSESVTFTGGTGSLVLDQPAGFTGHIVGFTGTAPDAAHSDTIDLLGIDFNSSHFAESYSASTGLLTASDGTHEASFTFDNFNATLDFASDGKGGTLITDPPAAGVSGAAAPAPAELGIKLVDDKIGTVAGQSNDQSDGAADSDGKEAPPLVSLRSGDNFVFHQILKTDSNANANSHDHANELTDHPDIQSVYALAALISTDPRTEATFEFIHNDALTAQMHQVIQSGHALLQ